MIVVRIDILLYRRVIKPSKKAASANTGINPNIIFTPSLAPALKASIRRMVPGNKKLFPKISPAALASMMAVISKVPCTNTTSQKSSPRPYAAKK